MTQCKCASPWRRKRLCLILVACLLLVALTLGVIGLARQSHRVLSFHSVSISDNLYAYWQARYRYEYLTLYRGEGASDTAEFWASVKDAETGVTYGEDLRQMVDLYVARIAMGSYLFDAAGYTVSDQMRAALEEAMENRLRAVFSSDEDTFNEMAAPYGFDYKTARRAAIHETKANLLASYAVADATQTDAYFREHYVRVGILRISPDHVGGAGALSLIREGLAAGATEEAFLAWASDPTLNDTGTTNSNTGGYYFAEDSAYYGDYASTLPTVAEAALSLSQAGDWCEVSVADGDAPGTYFVYRYTLPEDKPYESEESEAFFGDLTRLAADHYFLLWLDGHLPEVKWQTEHIPTPVPQGVTTDLFRFFG
ncbi:MAG: hypothetical protein IJC29_00605 [Clostridia bacterium]|nr:hypothetical protein [Clostridia bacterium]